MTETGQTELSWSYSTAAGVTFCYEFVITDIMFDNHVNAGGV